MTIEERMAALEDRFDSLALKINTLEAQGSTIKLLLQWVVTPLLVILGGLMGIKMIAP